MFGNGIADYLTDDDAVALLLKQRLWLWLGEWFLDVTAGANWWQVLGTRPPALLLAEQELRRIASTTEDVVRVTGLALSFDHRTFIADVTAEIVTVNSTVVQVIQISRTLQAGA